MFRGLRRFIGVFFMLVHIDKLKFLSVSVGFYSWMICFQLWYFLSVEVYYFGWALLAFFVSLSIKDKGETRFQRFTFKAFFFVRSIIYSMSCFLTLVKSSFESIYCSLPLSQKRYGQTI